MPGLTLHVQTSAQAVDDAMTDREPEPGPDSGRLGREERIEDAADDVRARCRSRCPAPRPRPRASASARARTQISCSSAWPSGMACAALMIRLRNTWPRRASLPCTGGSSPYSRTKRARWRTSFHAMRAAESSTSVSSHALLAFLLGAREQLQVAHDRAHRPAASRASASGSSRRRISASAAARCRDRPRTARIVQARELRRRPIRGCPSTTASGLLISCATPAAIVPTESRRSVTSSCACELLLLGDVARREQHRRRAFELGERGRPDLHQRVLAVGLSIAELRARADARQRSAGELERARAVVRVDDLAGVWPNSSSGRV